MSALRERSCNNQAQSHMFWQKAVATTRQAATTTQTRPPIIQSSEFQSNCRVRVMTINIIIALVDWPDWADLLPFNSGRSLWRVARRSAKLPCGAPHPRAGVGSNKPNGSTRKVGRTTENIVFVIPLFSAISDMYGTASMFSDPACAV